MLPSRELLPKWQDQSHGRPVSHQTIRVTSQPTIMHEWWNDPARLVSRSCATCLRTITTYNRRCRVLNMTIDLAATKFARTITHFFRSIARYVSDLSAIRLFLWPYISRNMVANLVWPGLYSIFFMNNIYWNSILCKEQFSFPSKLDRHICFHFMQKWGCFHVIIISIYSLAKHLPTSISVIFDRFGPLQPPDDKEHSSPYLQHP